jgi:hypothetical protein
MFANIDALFSDVHNVKMSVTSTVPDMLPVMAVLCFAPIIAIIARKAY